MTEATSKVASRSKYYRPEFSRKVNTAFRNYFLNHLEVRIEIIYLTLLSNDFLISSSISSGIINMFFLPAETPQTPEEHSEA